MHGAGNRDCHMMFQLDHAHCVGEDGVAAVTIIMYVLMFASSLYTGYSYGVAPMLTFTTESRTGEAEKTGGVEPEGDRCVSGSRCSVPWTYGAAVSVFARPEDPVYALAVTGNRICTIALLFIGFNIFASGMFTALSNGVVSAVLAFSRSFVLMLAAMIVLPLLLGVNGIWLATPAAELMGASSCRGMYWKYRKRYGY